MFHRLRNIREPPLVELTASQGTVHTREVGLVRTVVAPAQR